MFIGVGSFQDSQPTNIKHMDMLESLVVLRQVAGCSQQMATKRGVAALKVVDKKIQSLLRKKAWRNGHGAVPIHMGQDGFEYPIPVDGESPERHSYQVLVFEPQLTHSVWKDWGSDDPMTEEEVIESLRAGVESGKYVGWRVITIHKDVMGRDAVALARFQVKEAEINFKTSPSE